jgi:cytidylate kinase
MKFNIAIDGPSAAGKSTIADILAERLGYNHLDTGAMYRAVAYKALNTGIALDDEEKIVEMIGNMDLEMRIDGSVILDGVDVSEGIRANEISMGASDVSKLEGCREALVAMQQKICAEGGYILDGRDIGTAILPKADLKIFLTASVAERARRRFLEMKEKGEECSEEEIRREIEERDYRDMHREIAPLKQAEDAVLIDSSDMSIDEVKAAIIKLIESKR